MSEDTKEKLDLKPMYKNGKEMKVTKDKDGRAELARHGWTEEKNPK